MKEKSVIKDRLSLTLSSILMALPLGLAGQGAVAQDAPASAAADEPSTESIGVNLNGLVLLGETQPVRSTGSGRVTLDGITLVSDSALTARLQPLLGQPISEALLARIQAEVVGLYRNAGYPFVAVATPPQEITSGVLNLRVVPFRVSQITATGTTPEVEERLLDGIRQPIGQPVFAPVLEEDIEWLNRSPMRQVGAEFSPGAAPSTTDITLAVTEMPKRWTITGGLTNTGATTTGQNRLSVGLGYADLLRPGSLLSYRATVSTETASNDDPAYLGQSILFTVPTGARQELSLAYNLTQTYEGPSPFLVDKRTSEFDVTWEAALSSFGSYPGNVLLGYSQQAQTNSLFFEPDFLLGSAAFTSREFFVGWNHSWRSTIVDGPSLRHAFEVAAHYSPGNLGPDNSDEDAYDYSLGRVTSATYAYLTGGYDLSTRVFSGRRLLSGIDFQFTGSPLPETDQLSIGGLEGVRGYSTEDGAYDRGIIWRNQISLLTAAYRQGPYSANPYVFFDAGSGLATWMDQPDYYAGVGIGSSFGFGPGGTAAIVIGLPLITQEGSEAFEPNFEFNLNYRF